MVDDGVGGYMDNGMDDWTGTRNGAESHEYDDEDEFDSDTGAKKKCTFSISRCMALDENCFVGLW